MSLVAQVRRARFDSGQLELLSIAQKDEILALKERLRLLTDEAVDSDTGLRTIPDLRMENARLKVRLRLRLRLRLWLRLRLRLRLRHTVTVTVRVKVRVRVRVRTN